jgi:hypothetical protein
MERFMPKHKHLIFYFLWLCFSLNAYAIGMVSDTTPNQFTFTDQTGAALSTAITSNTITVTGINAKATVSITGGSFSVNGGAYRTSSTTLSNRATVRIKQMSSKANSTVTNAVLTIGGVSDTFSVITLAASGSTDTTPNAFSFTDQTNLALKTTVTSNTITIGGINAATAISISGGSYSINGGAFVTTAGTVTNGNTVAVKVTTAGTNGTTTNSTLTVGGVVDTFSVTTVVATNGFLLPPMSAGDQAFTSEHFKGATVCANCHNGLIDNTGKDVSIQKDWSATMMANAARDPLWKAKVRSEINRAPHLVDAISDKCTRCHAPMANFEAKNFNEPKSILAADGGFLNASHPRHNEAMSGVGCTLCHQIQNAPNLGMLSSFTGHYEIGNDKKIYGQYMNPFVNPMIRQTGYTPTGSAHMESSKLCSTCHNVKTPFVDQYGTLLSTTPESEFPEQMSYSEWEHSNHAKTLTLKTCQNCHLPLNNGVKI